MRSRRYLALVVRSGEGVMSSNICICAKRVLKGSGGGVFYFVVLSKDLLQRLGDEGTVDK